MTAPVAVDADQEPQRHTGHLLRRAQQVHVAAWTRLVSAEISTVQYSILVALDRRGSRVNGSRWPWWP